MKWLFVFLVLFNLGAFGWSALSRAPQGEIWQLREFHPEKIRVLSPDDVVKLSAQAKPKAQATRSAPQQCLVWSGVTEVDVGHARNLLASLSGKPKFNELQGGERERYWVYLPPAKSTGEAEKTIEKLRDKGVELEACSQFGIGILSCFMVADRFEVETYRVNHKPLRVIIEGPTKYFTIEVQDEPERSLVPTRPQSDIEDGPPRFSGTRITIYLKPNAKFDTLQTLRRFAVNVDYDIAVYLQKSATPQIIDRWGWEKASLPEEILPLVRISYSNHRTNVSQITENLRQILVASVIRFEKYDSTKHLRGCAWLWLLKDEHNNPCPQRGYLKLSDELSLTGLLGFLANFTYDFHYGLGDYTEWEEFISSLKADYARHGMVGVSDSTKLMLQGLYDQVGIHHREAKDKAEEFITKINRLGRSDVKSALKYLESFLSNEIPWYQAPNIVFELLQGHRVWEDRVVNFDTRYWILVISQ